MIKKKTDDNSWNPLTRHSLIIHHTEWTIHELCLLSQSLREVRIHNLNLHFFLQCTTLLCCTTLFFTTLHCTTLHYTALHSPFLRYILLSFTTPHYPLLHCTNLTFPTLPYLLNKQAPAPSRLTRNYVTLPFIIGKDGMEGLSSQFRSMTGF